MMHTYGNLDEIDVGGASTSFSWKMRLPTSIPMPIGRQVVKGIPNPKSSQTDMRLRGLRKNSLISHWKDKCWKRYPSVKPKFALNMRTRKRNNGSSSKTNEAPVVVIVLASKKDCWLLDNAAAGHVCNQKSFFIDYHDNPTGTTGATRQTYHREMGAFASI